ncbi:unnamed protein product [Caenorhabditis auriculariae]|uniref:Serine/threonine-protein kinase RIO1 n=1 Tax=Caenorhabditis auriculariae TaxID=2777116 RepID=A0A8S1GPC8_9PELO|nr:unnamed protein product [Caenorhabditis auriculariae]
MEDIGKLNWNITNILENLGVESESSSGENEKEEEDYSSLSDYDDATLDFGDVGGGGGDFTKRFNAARQNALGPNSKSRMNEAEKTADSTEDRKRKRIKDRADRATVEQVLDPRTRLVLFRLLQNGTLNNIHGCISTGKEANVYHATSESQNFAVKIYKTSILTFKDRERYVTGEFRYRNGYCKHNPRKMNARSRPSRSKAASFEGSRPCHGLHWERWLASAVVEKNAQVNAEDGERMYVKLCRDMRKLYRECRLVHADLSEYNTLVFDGQLYIIDVSQSVEQDHPHALEFLRIDCNNVNKFFRELGVRVLSVRRLFEVIVDPLLSSKEMESVLESERSSDCNDDDAFFMSAFIPHKLEHVLHFERDGVLAKKGDEANNPFQNIVSKIDLKGDRFEKESCSSSDEDDEPQKNKESKMLTEEEYAEKERRRQIHTRGKEETPEERKARKAVIKEEKRENRKEKIPKHVKKRAHRQHMK